MSSIAWNDDLIVGHDLIDTQHRQIFAHFDAFLDGCNRRRGPEQLRELFGFLESYTASHFAAEEALMTRYAYPHAAEHVVQHQRFIEKFGELQRSLATSGPTVELLVITTKTLVYWLSEHIRNTDRQYAAFLRQHGAP